MPKTDAEKPANDEMVAGYCDGLDLSNPEPSANRSRSYRHGFESGRVDRGVKKRSGSFNDIRKMADEAMEADEHDRML